MTFDASRARAALDAIHALGAMANATSPVRCRFMTAVGSATVNGTELATAQGYTGGASAPSVTYGAATAPSTSASTTAVTVTNMPAATVTGIEIWDSSGTPLRQEIGSLTTSKTTASGDTLTFSIGALTSALA